MRRPGLSRAVAPLFALWFTAYTVEPVALHACDVHDATRAPASAAPSAHGAHGAHGAHSAATQDGQPADQTSCCTCPGACAVTPPLALPTAGSIALVVVATATADTGLPDYEYVPVAAAHVLPFANGPPTRA